MTVTAPTDYTVEITEPSVFEARTFDTQRNWADPHLWLYNSNNILIAANDDYYGLQSRISINLQPGTYRLRAGVCCGDPNR